MIELNPTMVLVSSVRVPASKTMISPTVSSAWLFTWITVCPASAGALNSWWEAILLGATVAGASVAGATVAGAVVGLGATVVGPGAAVVGPGASSDASSDACEDS